MEQKKRSFKTAAKDVKITNKYNKFILKNSDQSIGVDRTLSMAKKYRVLISRDLEEYMGGYVDGKRALVNVFIKFLTMMTAIRFLCSSIFNRKWVIILMSDANYLLGNQRLISGMAGLAALIICVLGLVFHVQEWNKTSKLIEFIHGYKYNKIIALNNLNARRLAVRINLMSKYLIRQAFWPLVIVLTAMMTIIATAAYLDPNSEFILMSVIFWQILWFEFTIQFSATLSLGFLVSYLSALYLRYKFNEVTEKIRLSLTLKSKVILMRAISEHNTISELTHDLNTFFSYVLFILYFFVTPPLMLCMYLIHAPSTNYYARFVAGFLFVFVVFTVFSVTLLFSLVSQSAHRPRPLMYTFLMRNKVTTSQSLKIMAFIEKLSGPDIGFYCWNLFPMNNNQFYEYVVNCAVTYFLILDMIR